MQPHCRPPQAGAHHHPGHLWQLTPHGNDSACMQLAVASGDLQATLDAVGRAQGAHRPLVLSHASRLDVLLGLVAAHASAAGPHAGAIVMTGQAGGQLQGHAARIIQVCL